MSESPPAQLLPILVAHLADDDARDVLEGVALVQGVAQLVLEAPPMDRSVHALEICTPTREPLVVLAQPVGPPTAAGYPLRLALQEPVSTPAVRKKADSASELSPRRRTAHTLTEQHTRDLIDEPAPRGGERPKRVEGRHLAGGKLIIEESVGKGGAGTVYRARHRDLGIPVAVKVMHQSYERDVDYCRRFHAEALAASRLDHRNLTRVLDYGQEPDGLLYMAMEFLDGHSLRDVLGLEKRLEPMRAVRLMVQVCAGLTHAHARDILHRDIKPENLMLVRGLDDEGQTAEVVKVCDFGIAHIASSEVNAAPAGTPEYMAPEQFRGEDLDTRVDVYACGVVLYELLTGDVPITGRSLQEIWGRVQVAQPEPPSRRVLGIDPRLDAIVLRALAKDKTTRFASVREMRQALQTLAPQAAPGAGVDPEPSSPSLQAPRVAAPDWLERGTARYMAATELPPQSADMGRAVAPLLKQIAETRDPAQLATLATSLENKLRAAMEMGYAEAAWRIRSTLETLVSEARPQPGRPPPADAVGRTAWAEQLLRVMSDPKVLGPLAERALGEPAGDAGRLVVAGGAGGAYALYTARLKTTEPQARERFVELLLEIGAPGGPMLRAGLERLEPRLGIPGAAALVEDLLRALPRQLDDSTGEIAARYARSAEPVVAARATSALAPLWGQRARPLLVALLAYPDDRVFVAAVAGLCELSAVDEDVLRRLAPVIAGQPLGGRVAPALPTRLAAVEALAQATPEATEATRAYLGKAVSQVAPGSVDDALLAAIARAFLTLKGDPQVVGELWRRAQGALRGQLEALLRAAAPR